MSKNNYINHFGLFMGVVGLLTFCYALSIDPSATKNQIVLFATFLLLASALIQVEPFFSGLQGIAFISAIMVFFNLAKLYNLTVFVVLAFIFAIWYFGKHKFNAARLCAFIGLVGLCLGIVLGRNEPMLVCGIFLAIYAIFSIKEGFSVGWVFLVLNVVFAVVAAQSLGYLY